MNKPRIIWLNVILFALTALIALIWVPIHAFTVGFDSFSIIALIICFGFCGMSITAGYHRLWAHKAYQANTFLKVLYALGGAFALQNSALHWASDHRIHHNFVDQNDKDPYSAGKGFWYSHIGWMCREYQAHRYDDYSNVPDLKKDKVVMWQHKYYLPLTLLMNLGIPILLGLIHGDVLTLLLSVGWLRLFLSHHTTFFINSLAHIWGTRPYTDENSARDNGFIAFFTFGEGYHNFHHKFAADYRNGIHWWQFDPTKWLIKSCSWFGFTRNLKKCPEDQIELAKLKRQLEQAKNKALSLPNGDEILDTLQSEFDQLQVRLKAFYTIKKKLISAKRQQVIDSYEKLDLQTRYFELKQALEEQKQQWLLLTAQVA
jgi:stearoyl-CoA desaturase (Delta-9 desaturase)